MEKFGEARLVARSGSMLFFGAGLVAVVNSFALASLGVSEVDASRMRVLGLLSFACAAAVLTVPWQRFSPRVSILPAVVGLVLLLASGRWTGYATTDQARVAYPAFFMLIFGWLGLTHPRWTSTLFAPVVALGCGWLTVTTPHVTVSFAGLAVAIVTSVLIAETIAWAMARSRRYADDLGNLVSASSHLREVLNLAEGAELAAASTRAVLHADRVELLVLESGAVPGGHVSWRCFELATAAAETGEVKGDRDGLAIPLAGPSGVIAVVVAFGVPRDPVTEQMMRLLSTEFGGRLEQLRLLEALGEQTLRDALTGVGSRRHADALVSGLEPGDSLLLIDVDHFKVVNDTRGHLGGDRLLEQLGLHLRTGLRDHDSVARYGGDEFLVRLHASDGDSREIAHRLLDTWIAIGDVPTFSVGIAGHRRGTDPQATFGDADRALYVGKDRGRARVVVASDTEIVR
ncbi:MAG TPA: GGDEF domain-containing protein [Acidimicrobiia bacterium]|nr:GGDEF domain-containing protein [Acidimicrobiia bacterium]